MKNSLRLALEVGRGWHHLTLCLLLLFSVAGVRASGADQDMKLRDGAHDFDFNIGVWHTHIRRMVDPLSGSQDAMVLDGTVTVRKIWDGKAQLEEIEADGPKGHWEGLTLFLYDPKAHQWNQYFLNSKTPYLWPPQVGEFHDGRVELFAQNTIDGKTILVRTLWTGMEANGHRFDESYSDDGGKTWKLSFHADLTRDGQAKQDGSVIADPPEEASAAGQHDFDFDLGSWKTHSSRLLHPLTGSHDWVQMDGTTSVQKVWGGRANLAVYDATGTGGHVTLMGLRWFDPATHEWSLNFATPQVGTLGTPGVGTFKNGRGDFYDYESIGGRSVLVRFSIWKITDDTAQSEQAFSDDGGKTWEVNWVNHYERVKQE